MIKEWFEAYLFRRKLKQLPSITVKETHKFYRTFTGPNPDNRASIYNEVGDCVGSAVYGVSPLFDRVYIYQIEINQKYWRNGFATAFLAYLTRNYHQPITAVKELERSYSFWDVVRKFSGEAFSVTKELTVTDMMREGKLWSHLKPEAERLDKVIEARLSNGEPWELAISRGFDD